MRIHNFIYFLLSQIVSATVIDVSEESLDTALNKQAPTFLLFYNWGHETVALNGYYSDFSRIYENDNLIFARIDAGENPNVVKKYGLTKIPTVMFFNPGGDPEVEELNLPPVKAIKRKIRRDLGIDHTNDHTNYPLNQLTDNTFRLGIQGKEALVLFTGNCPNCENVVNIFRQIAADYRYSNEVAIADVDPKRLDSQLLPNVFAINHYPTVLYFSHEGSQIPLRPQYYNGEMTYTALTEFLESHGITPTSRWERSVQAARAVWKMLFGGRKPSPPREEL